MFRPKLVWHRPQKRTTNSQISNSSDYWSILQHHSPRSSFKFMVGLRNPSNKKKNKKQPSSAFQVFYCFKVSEGSSFFLWVENFVEQKEKLLHELKLTGFDCYFGPLTLTVSFRKGVVTRRCQSDLALGYAPDPFGSATLRTPTT